VHGQTKRELALGNQPRRQGRDRHARLSAVAGVLGAHCPASDELGRYQVDLLGDLLANPTGHLSAAGTELEFRLDRDRLGLQVHRQRVAHATAAFLLAPLSSLFVDQYLVAVGTGPLAFGLHVLDQLLESILLFWGEPIRLRTKQLALQFCNLGFGLGELLVVFLCQRLQSLHQLTQLEAFRFQLRFLLEQSRNLRLQPLVLCTELVVAHAESSSRNLRRNG